MWLVHAWVLYDSTLKQGRHLRLTPPSRLQEAHCSTEWLGSSKRDICFTLSYHNPIILSIPHIYTIDFKLKLQKYLHVSQYDSRMLRLSHVPKSHTLTFTTLPDVLRTSTISLGYYILWCTH